ncbi:cohesin domain-containing protein [Aestuariibacter sp. A3R04]|uniref:cohesin domain-containing protein n=1 Tax=Aestuariibacter sp. A3R04 TaxID=2841571 RepID=UPI001C081F58|nr:cohesin domain-containing protein [Aestuariibacter sp. A3R04]MBU3022048.1 cohesin domain-containing protein [Aestuariibacter sp. A3R04]
MKWLIALCILSVGLPAYAGIISVELSDSQLSVGESVDVSIQGTGFSAFDSLNVELEFDTDMFDFNVASVGGDLMDASPFILDVSPQPYGIALSFLDFTPYTGGNFTVATFSLTALVTGETAFKLVNALAGDFFTGPLAVEISPPAVTARVTEVPGPATFGLLSVILVVMLGMRKIK